MAKSTISTRCVIVPIFAAHEEKKTYLAALLPKLAELRRHRGLPHWIVVDEAHYFLGDSHAKPLVDLEFGAYLLTRYRSSQLGSELVKTLGSIIVAPFTDPGEVGKDRYYRQGWNRRGVGGR
jgi:hypothetical protein